MTTITWNNNDGYFSISDINLVEKAINDMNYTLTVENDGIGAYEFWGHQSYDHGTNYLILENINPIEVEIKNGIVAPDTAIKELLDNLLIQQTLYKTCYPKNARHEDDCYDMSLEVKLVYEMKIHNGKLILKLWWEENE